MEIFREVAQTDDHPDAEKVYQSVRKRMPTVFYRTLWWLKELGLITTLGPPRERTRFDANLSCHHHFVCVRCGLTRDFYSDKFNKLRLPEYFSIKPLSGIFDQRRKEPHRHRHGLSKFMGARKP